MSTITLNHLAKIEGHASLDIKVRNNKLERVNLKLTEGARFFEELVKGRPFYDIPSITSRICGICSQAHIIASIKAIEDALEIKPPETVQNLRELISIGGLIQSHAIHLYFLTLPDYFGKESAIELVKTNKQEIETALKLKDVGNNILKTISGREIHPISCLVGGSPKIPSQEEVYYLIQSIEDVLPLTKQTIDLFNSLKYPKYESETEYYALRSPFLTSGYLSNSYKKIIHKKEFRKYFHEFIKKDEKAERIDKPKEIYRVGALARLKINNYFHSDNPYHYNIAQAYELRKYLMLALQILKEIKLEQEPIIRVKPRKSVGISITEAPRGTLMHEYHLDGKGNVIKADITVPTSHNLKAIQNDITNIISPLIKANLKKEQIILEIEKLIRAYDPCISCATHFLKVNWI